MRYRWLVDGRPVIEREWVRAATRFEAFQIIAANYPGAYDVEYWGETATEPDEVDE